MQQQLLQFLLLLVTTCQLRSRCRRESGRKDQRCEGFIHAAVSVVVIITVNVNGRTAIIIIIIIIVTIIIIITIF